MLNKSLNKLGQQAQASAEALNTFSLAVAVVKHTITHHIAFGACAALIYVYAYYVQMRIIVYGCVGEWFVAGTLYLLMVIGLCTVLSKVTLLSPSIWWVATKLWANRRFRAWLTIVVIMIAYTCVILNY